MSLPFCSPGLKNPPEGEPVPSIPRHSNRKPLMIQPRDQAIDLGETWCKNAESPRTLIGGASLLLSVIGSRGTISPGEEANLPFTEGL